MESALNQQWAELAPYSSSRLVSERQLFECYAWDMLSGKGKSGLKKLSRHVNVSLSYHLGVGTVMVFPNENASFARLTEAPRKLNLLRASALFICAGFVIFTKELKLKVRI